MQPNPPRRRGPLGRLAGRTLRALRNPQGTRHELDILRDYRRFERRYGKALRSVHAEADGPQVLIVSRSDWPFQVKMEGILAKALELQGRRATVLTMPGAHWAERYFKSFGIDQFVYLSTYTQRAEAVALVEQQVAEVLGGELTVPALKRLTFRGANVGIQTLSSVSRTFQQGRISLAEPRVRVVLERVLRESLESVLAAEALLDDVDPEIVMFIERGYAGFGSISDVALDRGLNVIQYGHAGIHWHNALNLKRYTAETRRVHPHSLSEQSWHQLRDLPWTDERERELMHEFELRYGPGEKPPEAGLQTRPDKPPEQVLRELGLSGERPIGVIFSHILWDANLFYGDDLFDDQEVWLVESVRAACANPEVDWIVKLHPANAYKAESGRELNDKVAIREALGELPSHVHLLDPDADINTRSLFRVTDVGVTIRGTIGMELPCFGVPVLTAGTGRYSGLGFTIDSSTREEYLARLAALQDIEPLTEEQTLLAKRHAWSLFLLRPLRITSFENHFMDSAHLVGHPLGHNLDLTLETAEDLRHAGDLHEFGTWAIARERLDYLARAPEALR